MTKKELRKKYLEKRSSFTLEQVISNSKNIIASINNAFDFSGKNISTFLGINKFKEFDSWQFINSTSADCYAPVMQPKHELIHRFVNADTELKENSWGIKEPVNSPELDPAEFDFVIVPLIVCDKKGNRLGYGGGYYDRFLKKCNRKCIFIGVGFFDIREEIPEITELDVPLHYYASPNGLIKF